MARQSTRVQIIACVVGIAHCSSTCMMAAEKAAKPAAPPNAATSSTATPAVTKPAHGTDVALVDGKLTGKLLTANGQPIDGAVVSVLKDGKEVGKAVTTSDGSYTISDLKTGAHVIQTANGQQQVRLWAKEVAPASAKSQLTISQTAIRGQGIEEGGMAGGESFGGGGEGMSGGGGGGGFGGFGSGMGGGLGGMGGALGGLGGASMGTLLMGGLAIGAASFAAVQVSENQQLQDQIDQLQSP